MEFVTAVTAADSTTASDCHCSRVESLTAGSIVLPAYSACRYDAYMSLTVNLEQKQLLAWEMIMVRQMYTASHLQAAERRRLTAPSVQLGSKH
jgi:hypothetical protein